MEDRCKTLFEHCTKAQMVGDRERATAYANECTVIRGMVKSVLQAQMALDEAMLRLQTIGELSEATTLTAPVISVIKALEPPLRGIMPQVSQELAAISEVLSGLLVGTAAEAGTSPSTPATGEEARGILRKAEILAEYRMTKTLPQPPTQTPAGREADTQG